MVFVKKIELLECFICMLDTPTSSEYAENVRSMSLLVVETIAKKYCKTQKATLKFLEQGDLKFHILMD